MTPCAPREPRRSPSHKVRRRGGPQAKEVIIMEATIRDKAERGIKAYLERQGFEIIEEGWAHGSDRIYLRTWEVAVSQVPK